MKKYTERQVIMISPIQKHSLGVLKNHRVKVSQFIRDSITEKLQREWKSIKEKSERIEDVPDWFYD